MLNASAASSTETSACATIRTRETNRSYGSFAGFPQKLGRQEIVISERPPDGEAAAGGPHEKVPNFARSEDKLVAGQPDSDSTEFGRSPFRRMTSTDSIGPRDTSTFRTGDLGLRAPRLDVS